MTKGRHKGACLFLLFVFSAILQRCCAGVFLKHPAKIRAAAEAAKAADLPNGQKGIRKHTLGGHDPGLKQVVHHRKAGDLFELAAEVVLADVDLPAKVVNGDVFPDMPVDILHRFLNHIGGGGCGLGLILTQAGKQRQKAAFYQGIQVMGILGIPA